MDAVLALLVAAGFVWSIILFFAAVFISERDQEAGFGWALAGAALYCIVFSDRLPGVSTDARAVLQLLPGVTYADSRFTSSVALLWVLLAVYLLRVLVFYKLFGDVDIDGDGDADDVNDLVAPFLSYVCFAISAVTAISGVYRISAALTILCVPFALLLYYYPPVFRLVLPYLELVYETLRGWVVRAGLRIGDAVVLLIVGIARMSIARAGRDAAIFDTRIAARRRASEEAAAKTRERQHEAIQKLARRRAEEEQRRRNSRGRRKPPPRRLPNDPNQR